METALQRALSQRMAALSDANLIRKQRVVEHDPEHVLCSNDYLGVAGETLDVSTIAHLVEAGVAQGSGGSRLISGTHSAHVELEREIATWLGREDAIFFASGYQANVGTLSALAQKGDTVFSDALNHASLIDGIRLSGAQRVIYPHHDMEALERALQQAPSTGLRIVVTDAIFSMDGDLARLRTLAKLRDRYGAVLVVDEAHSLGVYGDEGRGLVDHLGLRDSVDVIIGPCGKSLGSGGAFVAGSSLLREYLYNRSRAFVFSTAPPPLVAALTLRALGVLRSGDRQRALWGRIERLADALRARGFWEGAPLSPIFPIVVGSEQNALALASALDRAGIFVHPVRPPTVPKGSSRLRVTVSARTPFEVIERFVDVLDQECERLAIRPVQWSHGSIEE